MENNIKKYLSIVLPTYNRLYSIQEIFLPCLEKQVFLDYELIVIDD
jgi:glycosyltransferase involved in cell wall biosynthesis